MSRYRRADLAGASYFFTVVTERRQPVLVNEDVRAALREAIETVRVKRPFAIDAWVLLPDHLHAIWTLPEPCRAGHLTRADNPPNKARWRHGGYRLVFVLLVRDNSNLNRAGYGFA